MNEQAAMNEETPAPGTPPPYTPSLLTELRKLYVLLFWVSLAQYPLAAGLDALAALPMLASWVALLMLGKLPRLWRWAGWALVSAALAAAAIPFSSWWISQVGCPHCFRAEWYYLGFGCRAATPWILWGLVSLSLAVGLLLPQPTMPWYNRPMGKGNVMIPWALLGVVLIWPMLFVGGLFWGFLPSGSYGG